MKIKMKFSKFGQETIDEAIKRHEGPVLALYKYMTHRSADNVDLRRHYFEQDHFVSKTYLTDIKYLKAITLGGHIFKVTGLVVT